jgi:hypothetical protein
MDTLVSGDDLPATIRAILLNQNLWKLGLAANLVVPLIAIAQLWLEYLLFRPASRQLAILFVLLNLASLSVEAVSKVFQLMILPLAEGGLQNVPLVGLALHGHSASFNTALVFFGTALVVLAVLIWRSTYLPRAIAVLVMFAGMSYFVASVSQLLAPTFAEQLGIFIYAPMLIGEASLCFWFLAKGVSLPKWGVRQTQLRI